jgi:DNA-binding NarL/FixJ family response regulator
MGSPVRIAIVDDYEVVVVGVAHMFDAYQDRIEVVQLAPDQPVTVPVDVALFDTFAQGENSDDLAVLLANPLARRVAVYSWLFDESVVAATLRRGVAGYLSKALPARTLVEALERIHRADTVVAAPTTVRKAGSQDWPGREEGLTEREAEVLALITQGHSNADIAAITHLSINSVKTHIRNAYAKIDVNSRTQAVLWGIAHGMRIDRRRIEWWRPQMPSTEPR